jgi:hypothetical protein
MLLQGFQGCFIVCTQDWHFDPLSISNYHLLILYLAGAAKEKSLFLEKVSNKFSVERDILVHHILVHSPSQKHVIM